MIIAAKKSFKDRPIEYTTVTGIAVTNIKINFNKINSKYDSAILATEVYKCISETIKGSKNKKDIIVRYYRNCTTNVFIYLVFRKSDFSPLIKIDASSDNDNNKDIRKCFIVTLAQLLSMSEDDVIKI